MKILYFITTSNWGGASRHVYDLCKYQKSIGNKVYLAVGSKGQLFKEVKQLQIPIFVLQSVQRNISPINDIKSVILFRMLVKKLKPDIVHLHSSKAGILGRMACTGIKNIKVVFTVHGWAFTDGVPSKAKKFIYRNIERFVSPLTDLFICVSKFDKSIGLRDRVLKRKSNVVVIHNGSSKPSKDLVNFSVRNPVRLVMIARFSNQKDQETLIRAIINLPKDAYKLTFVGDGNNLERCKKLVLKYNLTDNVSFVGFSMDIPKFLIENDVFIMTSHYEGLPIGIIEAMSYGLPIVASNVGGNSELVINDKNGYLIDDKNSNQLNKYLQKLLNNTDLIKKMGNESYKLFLKEFTLSDNLNKINQNYERLIKSKE